MVRRWLILLLPPLTVLSVLLLVVDEVDAAIVVTLGFWAFAYAIVPVSGRTVPSGKAAPILSGGLRLLSLGYLALQSVLAVAFILLRAEIPLTWIVVAQLVPAAGFLTVFLSATLSNDAVTEQIAQQEHDRGWHRAAVNELERLRQQAPADHAGLIVPAIEDLRYSAIGGTAVSRPYEQQINQAIVALRDGLTAGATPDEIRASVENLCDHIRSRNREISNFQ